MVMAGIVLAGCSADPGPIPAEPPRIEKPQRVRTLWSASVGGGQGFTFQPALAAGSVFAAARDGQWEHRAAQLLSEDLSRAHRKVVVEVVGADGVNERRLQERDVVRYRGILEELRKEEQTAGFAALSVAVRELSMLADRTARHASLERRQ